MSVDHLKLAIDFLAGLIALCAALVWFRSSKSPEPFMGVPLQREMLIASWIANERSVSCG